MLPAVLIIVVIVIVALAIIGALLKGKLGTGGDYRVCKTVLSPAERAFLAVLEGVLPDGVTWLGKVRLGDVFVTRSGLSPSQRTTARNRINQKHVDFLLVRSGDFAPVAGVELDDRSHEEADRKERDAFVDQVFRSANLPILHVRAQASYNPTQLRAAITELIKNSPR